MDIANNWTLVVGVSALISMVFLWSKQGYLDPIRNREKEIVTKVKKDFMDNMKDYKTVIKMAGEEEFVILIGDIISFKRMFRELKEAFGRRMIPAGLIIVLLSVALVCAWGLIPGVDYLILYLMIFPSIVLIKDFTRMRRYENRLSRYLEGEEPSLILSDRD